MVVGLVVAAFPPDNSVAYLLVDFLFAVAINSHIIHNSYDYTSAPVITMLNTEFFFLKNATESSLLGIMLMVKHLPLVV